MNKNKSSTISVDEKKKMPFNVFRKGLTAGALGLTMLLSGAGMLVGCGKPGVKGDTGATGKSAYEIAVENGFEGSVQEWLDSLKGQDGGSGSAGKGIQSITKTCTNGLVDTYTITFTDGTTETFEITNGEDGVGTPGASSYTHIKYANVMPDSNDDMTDTASDYLGIYVGTSATAPNDYTAYTWYNIKGEAGKSPTLTIDKDGFLVIDGVKSNVCLYEKEVEKNITYNSTTLADYEYKLMQGNAFQTISKESTRISVWFDYKFKAGTNIKCVGDDTNYKWGLVYANINEFVESTEYGDSGWINNATQSGEVTTGTNETLTKPTYNAETKTVTLNQDCYIRINFAASNANNAINTTTQDWVNYFEIDGTYYGLSDKLNIDVEEHQSTPVDYFVNSVAHRGYSTIAPENTLSAYRLAKEKGFTTVECDVSFTSDGVGVLLHDATIDRTSNGTGNIADMTLEQVRQYDFGGWKSTEYAGEKIPTFEEFLSLCKSLSLHPYIEIKDGATQTEVESLITLVARYGMIDDVTWISFESDALTYVKNKDNTARLGYVVSTITEDTITTAKSLQTEKNEVFIDARNSNLTEQTINLCIENLLPLEVWTIDDIDTILNLDPYISGVTSNDKVAGQILYENNKD